MPTRRGDMPAQGLPAHAEVAYRHMDYDIIVSPELYMKVGVLYVSVVCLSKPGRQVKSASLDGPSPQRALLSVVLLCSMMSVCVLHFRVNQLSNHFITQSPHHAITASRNHCITQSIHHAINALHNQSITRTIHQ